SVLAAIYTWRFVEVAYLKPTNDGTPPTAEAPLGMLIPTWILIGASLVIGFYPGPIIEIASEAAATLLGGSG
ncbi:MAG: monovalent cation/H+ antiporter subunit D family protein, partial [Planctomycetes bacterium]|nr:monovalent cation/H+ antiporter subunit D family protein [Planctomycetota bacterium]